MDLSLFTSITTNLYRYGGILFLILANLGNILSLLIFFQRSWRKNVCVFYFLISLLIDFIYINSSMLGSILIFGFNIDLTKSNVFLCKIFKYSTFFPSTLSPTILILASIDRLLISSQNIDIRLYSSRRLACFLISISTIFWSIFFLHVLIKFDIQHISPFVSICIFDQRDFYYHFLNYSLVTINLISFIGMILLTVLSYKKVHRFRSVSRQQRQTVRTMRKKDFQLLRCLFAKDVIYIIFTTYICTYFLYKLHPQSRPQTAWQSELDRFIFNLGCFLCYIPSSVNFFIFAIISKAFRQSCKLLFWKMIGQDLNITRDGESIEVATIRNPNVSVVISSIAR